jgi:tripartite-type tricarboxylate transporter receptor subunit TctC
MSALDDKPFPKAPLAAAITLVFASLLVVGGASAIQPHRNGQGRILAWTGDRPMTVTPGVPNFVDTVPDTVAQTYFGLVVPARTPRAAIDRLSHAASTALQEQGFRDRLLAEGQFALGTGPEECGAFMQREAARWAPVLKRMDLQVD